MTKYQLNDAWVHGRTALREGIPWIVPASFYHLESIVKPSWKVFEWGVGGSTVYWAKKCSQVISVEANLTWVKRISKKLVEQKLTKEATILHIAKELPSYPNAIKRYPVGYFDLIFVDGRIRKHCATNAIRRLEPGGILMIDNSERLAFTQIIPKLEAKWDTVHFKAGKHKLLKAHNYWRTSFFVKPGG